MRVNNRSGVILIIVLVALAVLSLIAIGLSKRSSIELYGTRNAIGKVRAYAAARAGVHYVQQLLANEATEADTLVALGVKLGVNQRNEDVYKNVKVDKDTHFDVSFSTTRFDKSNKEIFFYGLEDETSRINLNAINERNFSIFVHLLTQFSVPESLATAITLAVAAWHQDNSTVSTENNDGAAKDLNIRIKKRPFDNIEELMFIQGMTPAIFSNIKDYVTVFPKDPKDGLRINFKTASDIVLRAVILGQQTTGFKNDEDLVSAAILQRNGLDNKPFTEDDGRANNSTVSALEQMNLNALLSICGYGRTEYYRVNVVGVDEPSNSKVNVTAVVYRPLNQKYSKIVYWQVSSYEISK